MEPITYTEEEVKTLCYLAIEDHCKLAPSHQPYNKEEESEMKVNWFEQNKKK